MPVIAMTREMGTGGREVAERVTDRLGLNLVLHHMVEHDLAQHLNVPETVVHHLQEGGATLLERFKVGSSKRLARYTAEEVLELASRGNVLIRGWGACVVLRDVPHVVRVRVCAPLEARERRLMERQDSKDLNAARREIEANDAAHKSALKRAYGVDREDALLYDVVLNTGRTSIEACAKLVCDLAENSEFRETEASRTFLSDKALEAHVQIKLRERFSVGTGVHGLEASVHDGKVVLNGTAVHGALVDDASKLVAEIEGVRETENRMVVVHGPRAIT